MLCNRLHIECVARLPRIGCLLLMKTGATVRRLHQTRSLLATYLSQTTPWSPIPNAQHLRNFSMKKWITWLGKQDFSYIYALLGESTLGLMFILYVFIARVVGPEQYGVFSAAVALGGILGVFIQFGLPMLLTRTVAANPQDGTRPTLRFLLIQILNTIPIFALLPLITHWIGFSREGMILCYLMIAAELCRSIKMSWRGIMKGKNWFHKESVSVFIERLFTVVLTSIILFITGSLILTTVALVLSRLIDNAGTGLYLARHFPLAHNQQPESWRNTYKKALPFALHGLLWIVYYQIDIIMLKALAIDAEVGFYGAAYRVMEIFAALPRVVFFVAFTRFAKYHATDPNQLPKQIVKALRTLFVLILPCLIIAGFIQPIAMPLLFGNAFLVSVSLLAVLLPGLALNMFNTVTETYLLTTEREITLTPLLLITSGTNILINLILIPRLGALGAAIATVASEAVLCALGMTQLLCSPIRHTARRIIPLILPCLAVAAIPTIHHLAGLPLPITAALLIVVSGALVYQMKHLYAYHAR